MNEDIFQLVLKLVYAFIVGSLGSAAYITALFFKFVGDADSSRSIVKRPFCKNDSEEVSLFKCLWYCFVGGFVAVVFQYDVPNFVAVQGLILGATWPAIVSQFLSGRMVNPSSKEINELMGGTNSRANVDRKSILKEFKEIQKKK